MTNLEKYAYKILGQLEGLKEATTVVKDQHNKTAWSARGVLRSAKQILEEFDSGELKDLPLTRDERRTLERTVAQITKELEPIVVAFFGEE